MTRHDPSHSTLLAFCATGFVLGLILGACGVRIPRPELLTQFSFEAFGRDVVALWEEVRK